MDLPFELGSELRPIAFEDVSEVVMFTPVFGDRAVNFSGHLIPNPFRITIRTDRRINGLPNIPLISGSTLGAQNQFAMVHLFERGGQMAQVVAITRSRRALPFALYVIVIFVFVDIDDGVGAKITRARESRKTAVEHLRIEHLGR